MNPRIAFGLGLMALVFTAGVAPAQVIAYDPINQPLGQFNGFASSGAGATWPSANTWQPFGGNGGVVSPGSLTDGPLQTAGNHVDFRRFDVVTGSIRSMASNQGGAGKDLWVSILMNPGANDQGMALYNGGSAEELFVGTPSGLTNYGLRVDGGFTGGASQTLPVSPTIAADGQTHFFGLHLRLTASVPFDGHALSLIPTCRASAPAAPRPAAAPSALPAAIRSHSNRSPWATPARSARPSASTSSAWERRGCRCPRSRNHRPSF